MKSYILIGIGALIGAAVGYGYYYWIGCASGTCPIPSRPIPSTLYGAILGALVVNMILKK